MSAKTGTNKIARRILRKHRATFYNHTLKDLELKLWVNDISSKPSLHLGKRGVWNKFRINEDRDPNLSHMPNRRNSNKIQSKKNWYHNSSY